MTLRNENLFYLISLTLFRCCPFIFVITAAAAAAFCFSWWVYLIFGFYGISNASQKIGSSCGRRVALGTDPQWVARLMDACGGYAIAIIIINFMAKQ